MGLGCKGKGYIWPCGRGGVIASRPQIEIFEFVPSKAYFLITSFHQRKILMANIPADQLYPPVEKIRPDDLAGEYTRLRNALLDCDRAYSEAVDKLENMELISNQREQDIKQLESDFSNCVLKNEKLERELAESRATLNEALASVGKTAKNHSYTQRDLKKANAEMQKASGTSKKDLLEAIRFGAELSKDIYKSTSDVDLQRQNMILNHETQRHETNLRYKAHKKTIESGYPMYGMDRPNAASARRAIDQSNPFGAQHSNSFGAQPFNASGYRPYTAPPTDRFSTLALGEGDRIITYNDLNDLGRRMLSAAAQTRSEYLGPESSDRNIRQYAKDLNEDIKKFLK